MTEPNGTGMFGPFADFMQSYMNAIRGAPPPLTQSILPDWSLIRIDETNSSAPATEQAIVAQQSYGRQLGRVMDALSALIDGKPKGDPAFKAFGDLKAEIDDIKNKGVLERIAALANDLETLKTRNAPAYAEALKTLKAIK